jgi:hypothetical protein
MLQLEVQSIKKMIFAKAIRILYKCYFKNKQYLLQANIDINNVILIYFKDFYAVSFGYT